MRWVWASFGVALVASATLLFAPLGTSTEAVEVGGGAAFGKVTHTNLVQEEGWWVAGLVAIPTAVAAAPLAARRRWARPVRMVSAALLGAFVVVGILSIGIFYAPAAICMVIAATRAQPLPAPP